MNHYFFNTTRKITISVLDLFNDIVVRRYDDGTAVKSIEVPLKLWTAEKTIHRLRAWHTKSDLEDIPDNEIVLPRMSVTPTGIEPRLDDNMGKFDQRLLVETVDDDTGDVVSQTYNPSPTPFNFNYELSIWSRKVNDLFQIVEQILPQFNPDIPVTIYELGKSIERNIPVALDSVSLTPDTQFENDELRDIQDVTMSFTAQGWLYKPLTTTNNIIKKVIVNMVEWDGTDTDGGETIEITGDRLTNDEIDITETISDYTE